jgi:hypothetical protein
MLEATFFSPKAAKSMFHEQNCLLHYTLWNYVNHKFNFGDNFTRTVVFKMVKKKNKTADNAFTQDWI